MARLQPETFHVGIDFPTSSTPTFLSSCGDPLTILGVMCHVYKPPLYGSPLWVRKSWQLPISPYRSLLTRNLEKLLKTKFSIIYWNNYFAYALLVVFSRNELETKFWEFYHQDRQLKSELTCHNFQLWIFCFWSVTSYWLDGLHREFFCCPLHQDFRTWK